MHARADDRGDIDDGTGAALSSSNRPRASRIGARKLTWKTFFQVSTGVVSDVNRPPSSFFGEMPGIVDQRVKRLAARRSLISAIGARQRAMVAEIDLDVVVGPASHGQSSPSNSAANR